jgi:hypothetical protein
LTENVITGRYIGLEPMPGGVMAHHLAVTKKDVSYQLWIKDGPEPVPLRYVVAGKDMRGAPQLTLEMRNWEPNASVTDANFAFTPPPSAKKVAFAPSHKG